MPDGGPGPGLGRAENPDRRGETGAGCVDFVEEFFFLINLGSFSSIWYWIGLAVVWSSASHWVLGVPNDLIQRARRSGGQVETDLKEIVRINCDRLTHIVRVSGPALLGSVFFMLTVLATLGFYYGLEFPQAVFLVLAPMTIVGALSVRTAHRLEAEGIEVPDIYRRLSRQRVVNQGIGVISIFITSLWGMWHNLHVGLPGH